MKFKMDEHNRIKCIAWAYPEQEQNARRYHRVILQDNTFNTNVYKFFLALIVVVDMENYTQIAMQALLSNERSEDFIFLMETFKELCGGLMPQVAFTDCDQGAMGAIAEVFPGALNKLCIWYAMQNIRKHGKGLADGALQSVLQNFKAAAFAARVEDFVRYKTELPRLLPQESAMHKYMEGTIFGAGRVEKWASCVHPGLHKLGIASTQRCEATFTALKLVVTRNGNMVDLNRALLSKVQDDAIKTQSRNKGGAVTRVPVRKVSPQESVKASFLRHFSFVFEAMEHERCSRHAKEDVEEQIFAAFGYEAVTVATGQDAVRTLLAELVADPTKANLAYDICSGEFIDPGGEAAGPAHVTMATRTSVAHFADLLHDQNVEELVRITIFNAQSEFGHLVALGPDGFFLCTCLRMLVYGLPCPHCIKALAHMRGNDKVFSFNAACISPRWRDSETSWTMAHLAAKPARLATADAELAGLPVIDPNSVVVSYSSATVAATVAAAGYADAVSYGKKMGGKLRGITSSAGIQRVLESTYDFFLQQLEVEKRSQ
ncbi:unnamed protein product [Ectocarpus sp. CCAP 1310/34]|nr:unnamed protein product [Ectocarpus sp. CCAP 1310/34]